MTQTGEAVTKTVEQLRTLNIAYGLASWNASINGSEENLQAVEKTQTDLMRFLADPAAFEQYRALDQSGAAGDDKLLARQIHLLHYMFAGGQVDPENIEEISRVTTQLQDIY